MKLVRPKRTDHEQLEYFGSRLRQLRAARKLSQRDLVKQAQIGLKTLMFYEQGKMMPSLTVAAKLARFFGVPMESLIYPDSHVEQVKDRELMEYLVKADALPHHDKTLIKDLIDALIARQILNGQKQAQLVAGSSVVKSVSR